MQTSPVVPSIASTGGSIGREAAMHLDLLWRDLMTSPDSVENKLFFRLITGEQHPFGNLAILLKSDDVGVVPDAVAPLLDLASPAAVLFVHGVSEPITAHLISLGFSQIAPLPAMAVDIASLAPTGLPAGYEFVRISSATDGTQWADVVAGGFGLPRGLARLMSPEVHEVSPATDAGIQYFGVRRGGCLVATSMLYLANDLAGIYCVATMPEERGKGLGAHVTAEASRAAREIGYGVGVLQSSAAGHAVYLALGFRDFQLVPMFLRTPG